MSPESERAVAVAPTPVEVARDVRSPYPGLRPFLEFESAYFYGRGVQVGEIIERLRRTRFVAVLGGSGSGKSSLVLAGVIPDLRSFGVAEAGDFWVPVVSTPGTNHGPDDSPITRLARRFCAVLKPLEEPAAAARVEDCARMLRSADGFAAMIERYGGDLGDTADLDPRKANFLLLIDQFEELFHHSNRLLADCDRLVERVIDNFKSPHPRVFVIITMRSEHLSDCARYLELPDAINRASYLVPRLNGQQIGESIEKPALRYLRLLARRAAQRVRRERGMPGAPAERPSVPAAADFDAAVRVRLIGDAEALRDKPDHLPLLQHLLFRLWEAAHARAARTGAAAPDRIDSMDLRRAVWADVGSSDVAELPGGNCLQICLEQWAQRLYGARPESAAALDTVLRRLAFKEPNTGTYTQQRASFDDLVRALELPDEAALYALLEPWLAPHAYLFWDTESRTVKVAHESFIRGWSHFSRCIDEEDERFQEFVRLLEECQRWQGVEGTAEHKRKQLIGGSRLRRVLDVGLDRALDTETVQHLASLLKLHREGERLAPSVPVVGEFLRQSAAEERRREQEEARRQAAERETKARRRRWLTGAATVVVILVLVPVLSWWVELRYGKRERLLHRAYAFDVETVLATDYEFATLESAQLPLRNVLVGTWHLAEGNRTSVDWVTRLFTQLVQRKRVDGAERTSILAEMRAVAALRTVLGLAVWPVTRPDGGPAARVSPPPSECQLWIEGSPAAKPAPRNARFFPRSTTADTGLAVLGGGSEPLQVYAARLRGPGQCDRGTVIVSIPPFKEARLAFDADLRQMFVGVSEPGAPGHEQHSVQRYEIAWPVGGTDPKYQERARISSAGFAASIWPNDTTPVRLPTIVDERQNATDVKLANGWVRLFHLEPVVLPPQAAPRTWSALEKASAQDCVELRDDIDQQARQAASDAGSKALAREPIPKLRMLQGNLRGGEWVCVLVTGRERPGGPGGTGVTNSSLSVYRAVPHRPKENKRVPIFPEIDFGPGELTEFRLGTKGEYDGWLAATRADTQWIGAPWSLDAWQRFSRDVCHFEAVSGLDQRRYAPVFDLIRGTSAALSAADPPTESVLCPERAASR